MSIISDPNAHTLVSIVERHPVLYNLGENDYKCNKKKNEIWKQISEELNKPVDWCKNTWCYLRKEFFRRLSGKKKVSGDPGDLDDLDDSVTKWPMFRPLLFLRRYDNPRGTTSNLITDASSELPEEPEDVEDENGSDALNVTTQEIQMDQRGRVLKILHPTRVTVPERRGTMTSVVALPHTSAILPQTANVLQSHPTSEKKTCAPLPRPLSGQNRPVSQSFLGPRLPLPLASVLQGVSRLPHIPKQAVIQPVVGPRPEAAVPVRVSDQSGVSGVARKSGTAVQSKVCGLPSQPVAASQGASRGSDPAPRATAPNEKRQNDDGSTNPRGTKKRGNSSCEESEMSPQSLMTFACSTLQAIQEKRTKKASPNAGFCETLAKDIDQLPPLRQAYIKLKIQELVFEEMDKLSAVNN